MTRDHFGSRAPLHVGDRTYQVHRLDALAADHDLDRLPYSIKVLLENLLRHEDGTIVTADDVKALASWDPQVPEPVELAFSPARILLQDFTGVPCVVDLAAMRDAVAELGGDPARVNPLVPAELVIDHSIVADHYGTAEAFARNGELEFARNAERYAFLRWGRSALRDFLVVPPNTGICHQVNLEHLARVVFVDDDGAAYPDSLVGTDSHTPMVNGLGVLGWGVGGIEAEAAMLGQPLSMLVPHVVGIELSGRLPEGSTATDLVLTVTELLRAHGVVGSFVEFFGSGVAEVPLENRATIGNMSPEYGSTVTMFPIDAETLRYLRFTGRGEDQVALVEAYAKEQGLWHEPGGPEPVFSARLGLDLSSVVPSLAGPARPQDRVPLDRAASGFTAALGAYLGERSTPVGLPIGVRRGSHDEADDQSFPASDPPADTEGPWVDRGEGEGGHGGRGGTAAPVQEAAPVGSVGTTGIPPGSGVPVTLADGTTFVLDHGHVVIAAITSCTNTSNPSVMVAAALLARNAVEAGLTVPPWVKTTLAPGSKVVMDYYERSGLLPFLERLGFHLVGFGCTTCIGNSGPLLPEISRAVDAGDLAVVSVLSGNRNFEGRINPDVRMNYLASPPLVVAYALAGTMARDLLTEPLGEGRDGPVFLRDLWPSTAEVQAVIDSAVRREMFVDRYAHVLDGDERWNALPTPTGERFAWRDDSTYVRRPPFFDGMPRDPAPLTDVAGARVLAVLGDSVTTDHISPAGVIREASPAGAWLLDRGVVPAEFNSYGSRRGNHEVMVRGTFANIRIRNRLAPGTEGGVTIHLPSGDELPIYDAAVRYRDEGTPLVVLAGKEYGSGSSRDWAAKGTALLGVRAVLAESFERIHRSNLVGMGVLPLELADGSSIDSLGLTGHERFDVRGLAQAAGGPLPWTVTVTAEGRSVPVVVRIDTPKEAAYYRHGGILPYVARRLAAGATRGAP